MRPIRSIQHRGEEAAHIRIKLREIVINCEISSITLMDLLQALLYSFADERPLDDTEFLLIRFLTNADIIGGSNREKSSMLSIIGIVKSLYVPNSLKDIKYMLSGAQRICLLTVKRMIDVVGSKIGLLKLKSLCGKKKF